MDRVRAYAEKLLGRDDFLGVAEGPVDVRQVVLATAGSLVLLVAEPILRQAEAEAQNLETSAEAAEAARSEIERTSFCGGVSPLVAAEATLRAATFHNRALNLLATEQEAADEG